MNSEQSPSSEPATDGPAPADAMTLAAARQIVDAAARQNKDKKKLRSAWISFVSRIVAQFVGSAATIVLGLMYLQKYHAIGPETPAAATESIPIVVAAAPLRERVDFGRPTIAVLPLDNFSGDSKYDHLANAITEALISELSQRDGLRVISRTSSMHYKGVNKPLPTIARELVVDWIVEGSIVLSNGRVRVNSQVIETSSDEHVWAASYDRRFQDALSLQAGLAPEMARDVDDAIARGKNRVSTRTRAAPGLHDEFAPPAQESADTTGANTRP